MTSQSPRVESAVQPSAPGDERAERFESHTERLRDEILALSQMVETALLGSVAALQAQISPGGSVAVAALASKKLDSQSLITIDHQVSSKRFAIELDCITLIATRQPQGRDLWAVASTLEIATELEHMADYMTDVAQLHFMIARVEPLLADLLEDVYHMAVKTQQMLHRAMEAFARQDLALARAVLAEDDVVDGLYNQIYRGVLEFIQSKPRKLVKQARHLVRIARNLERAADRVTNVCEWVIFGLSGQMTPYDPACLEEKVKE